MTIDLATIYTHRYRELLIPLVEPLECYIKHCLSGERRIDRITARAKSVDRFLAKAQKSGNDGKNKYSDPVNQIQDQLGARIVTFYVDDVERIGKEVERYFRPIEKQRIVPDSEREFGYFGQHYILLIPSDVFTNDELRANGPDFFELQIKTLYQHAWAEANHDLCYKADRELSSDEKRRIAFTAAQSWGADTIFNELFHSNINNTTS